MTCYIRGKLVEKYKEIMGYSHRTSNMRGIRKISVLRNINRLRREGDLERAEQLEARIDELYDGNHT